MKKTLYDEILSILKEDVEPKYVDIELEDTTTTIMDLVKKYQLEGKEEG